MYNFDFDIAAIIIYCVVIMTYVHQKHINNSQHKLFIALTVVGFLTPLLDIPACIAIDGQWAWVPVVSLNTAYYLVKSLTTLFFLLWILSLMEMRRNISWFMKLCLALPILGVVLLTITNLSTGWLFKYENGQYSSGFLRDYTYGVNIFYYVWALAYILKNHRMFRKSFIITICVISTSNFVCEMFQLFHSSILIHSFILSISVLLILINRERHRILVNTETGMASKYYLESTCKRFLFNKVPFSLVLVHIRNFENISNVFGAENVETILSSIEKYLVSISKIGNAFRYSDDTAAVLFSNGEDLKEMQEKIYDELNNAWEYNGVEYSFEYNITAISYPEEVSDLETLMNAIQSFNQIQMLEAGIIPFSQIQTPGRRNEQKIEGIIKNALQKNNFEVYYQPICTAKEQQFVTAEALVRLFDPVEGSIPPMEFIPVAEQNGLILQIGSLVLEKVCRFISENNMEKLGLHYIEVNLSTVQVMQHNFLEEIERIVNRYNVDKKYICFEITETASTSAPEIFKRNLAALNQAGYILALDDFGTGYANLQRMINSNFRIVKFDKELTQQFSSDEQLKNVYRKLKVMIDSMGSEIVSEGIETADQYEFVRDAGANYIQGYYFSKPLPEREFCEFLETRK